MIGLKITGAKDNGGYTIIETLIVLAASAALLLTVMVMISGQQGKTEFAQAIRDADSRIQDLINDFSTGYYDRGSNITCTANDVGGAPDLSSGVNKLGTNYRCVYLGRLIQFSGADGYNIHTMVGRQYEGPVFSKEVSTLFDAKPRLIHPTSLNASIPNLSRSEVFNGKINVNRIVYVDSITGLEVPTGALGIISNFGNSTGNNLNTGKQSPQLIALTSLVLGTNATQAADKFAVPPGLTTIDYVIGRPVAICFLSTGSNQYGVIRIGDNQGRLTTTTFIGGGVCPPDLIP